MSKNNCIFVIYFVKLCPYIIPDVSNNVQTQKPVIQRNGHFSKPLLSSWVTQSERVEEKSVNMSKT